MTAEDQRRIDAMRRHPAGWDRDPIDTAITFHDEHPSRIERFVRWLTYGTILAGVSVVIALVITAYIGGA